jgi:hypothetical protein
MSGQRRGLFAAGDGDLPRGGGIRLTKYGGQIYARFDLLSFSYF